jgi:hypothetical protein
MKREETTMNTLAPTLVATLLLPLLAITGVLLLVAARAIGGATVLTALLGGTGLILFLAVTVAGAALYGESVARSTA